MSRRNRLTERVEKRRKKQKTSRKTRRETWRKNRKVPVDDAKKGRSRIEYH